MKACTTCHVVKPESAFYACKSGKGGLMAMCKDCQKQAVRENFAVKLHVYRERHRLYMREYRARG